jgi:hypothetical protein
MTGTYEPGDYVKVEFPDTTTGIGEWMWVRVTRRDDEKQIVFGTLDNEPVGDYGGKIKLGSELVVSHESSSGLTLTISCIAERRAVWAIPRASTLANSPSLMMRRRSPRVMYWYPAGSVSAYTSSLSMIRTVMGNRASEFCATVCASRST